MQADDTVLHTLTHTHTYTHSPSHIYSLELSCVYMSFHGSDHCVV